MAEVEAFDETPAPPRLVPDLAEQPVDPVGDAVGSFIAELLNTATVELSYHRVGDEPSRALFPDAMMVVAEASAEVLDGWVTTITVGFGDGTIARVESIPESLRALPDAALRAAHAFRHSPAGLSGKISPTVDRALRDTVIVELLSHHQGWTKPGSRRRNCSPRRSST